MSVARHMGPRYRVASEIALGATAGRRVIDDAWLAGAYIVVNSFE
jgi:hypothetical protein